MSINVRLLDALYRKRFDIESEINDIGVMGIRGQQLAHVHANIERIEERMGFYSIELPETPEADEDGTA